MQSYSPHSTVRDNHAEISRRRSREAKVEKVRELEERIANIRAKHGPD